MSVDSTDPTNWYEAPAQPLASLPTVAAPEIPPWADLRTLLYDWEKRRLTYNAILALESLLLIVGFRPVILRDPLLYGLLLTGALGANLCYFAGPFIDLYARWLGCRHPFFKTALFVAGILLAMGLTAGILLSAEFFRKV